LLFIYTYRAPHRSGRVEEGYAVGSTPEEAREDALGDLEKRTRSKFFSVTLHLIGYEKEPGTGNLKFLSPSGILDKYTAQLIYSDQNMKGKELMVRPDIAITKYPELEPGGK
jgi:hypothetical protein